MDKFLNFCFKTGKILFSVLLIISLIVSLVTLCQTGIETVKLNNIKISYNYNIKQLVYNDAHQTKKQKTDINTNKNELKIENDIKKFAEEKNLSQYKTNELIHSVSLFEENEQENFFNHFIKFFEAYNKEAIALAVAEKKFDKAQVEAFIKQNINEIFSEEYNKFLELYNEEKQLKKLEKQLQESKRNTSFFTFLACFCIFVLCLFLPILIRIEENTRK